MPQQFVDLHTHSTASDGTLSPRELVLLAKESGLSAIALTDHDTVAGIAEAQQTATEVGVDFLPGIEISCECPRPGTLHVLGYGIDPNSPALAQLTKKLLEDRHRRNIAMIAKLNELGIPITMDDVRACAGGDVIGRPHIAQALVKRGIVHNTGQAFREYIGGGGKAWVNKDHLEPRRAFEMIHKSGGVAILAHAVHLRTTNDAQLAAVIKNLVDMGLDGIEVIHSDQSESFSDKLSDISKIYRLLQTGGSDFHGSNKRHIRLGHAGKSRVPRHFLDAVVVRIESASRRQSH